MLLFMLGIAVLCVLLLFLTIAFVVVAALRAQEHRVTEHADIATLKKLPLPPDSLFRIFQPQLIPFDTIKSSGYSSALALARILIGVQPTCSMVLGLWKPAYESYNLIIPNFLNMPQLVLPGYGEMRYLAPLTTYVSSRANQCNYCSAHCCTFAMRRGGIDPSIMQDVMEFARRNSGKGTGKFTELELCVIRVAYGLGAVPSCLKKQDCDTLKKHLSSAQVEWIVAAAAMFGAFNKYMDAMAVPLESNVYNEVMPFLGKNFQMSNRDSAEVDHAATVESDHAGLTRAPPPVDDWTVVVSALFHGLRPGGALTLESKLLRCTPTSAKDCIEFLKQKTGVEFSILKKLQHERFRRSLTAILNKNMVSDGIPLHLKVTAGVGYAKHLENDELRAELEVMLSRLQSDRNRDSKETLSSADLVLRLANALFFNPCRVTSRLVDEIETSDLSASNIIELISFLAVLQSIHRIQTFYHVSDKSVEEAAETTKTEKVE